MVARRRKKSWRKRSQIITLVVVDLPAGAAVVALVGLGMAR